MQELLFDEIKLFHAGKNNTYQKVITAVMNGKGVLDVDTVKGCTMGMKAYPEGGCYGECYALKNAIRSGIDFSVSVSRKFMWREHLNTVTRIMNTYNTPWYRIGTAGDPCHDWDNTVTACNALRHTKKVPVIITKHWNALSDDHISRFKSLGVIFNTSTSGMDTDEEIYYRVRQINRLRSAGIRSVNRVVTCNYGKTEWGRACKEKQDYLLSLAPVIDNPLRAPQSNARVLNGDIILTRKDDSVGGGKFVFVNRLYFLNGMPGLLFNGIGDVLDGMTHNSELPRRHFFGVTVEEFFERLDRLRVHAFGINLACVPLTL